MPLFHGWVGRCCAPVFMDGWGVALGSELLGKGEEEVVDGDGEGVGVVLHAKGGGGGAAMADAEDLQASVPTTRCTCMLHRAHEALAEGARGEG